MKKLLTGILLLSVVAFFSCRDINVQDLDIAREAWDNTAATKYAFELSVDCECIGSEVSPSRVIVENNRVIEVNDITTGEPMVNPFDSTLTIIDNLPGTFKTIDELFEEIDRARDDADVLETEYNTTIGYPTLISIDWLVNADDDEISYSLSNFEEL